MIREFQTADLDQVMNIWLEQNLLVHPFIDPSFFKKNTKLVRTILPSSEIYVQDIHGVKGFIGLTYLYISGLFIKTEHQRQGLGSSLIEKTNDRVNKKLSCLIIKNLNNILFLLQSFQLQPPWQLNCPQSQFFQSSFEAYYFPCPLLQD